MNLLEEISKFKEEENKFWQEQKAFREKKEKLHNDLKKHVMSLGWPEEFYERALRDPYYINNTAEQDWKKTLGISFNPIQIRELNDDIYDRSKIPSERKSRTWGWYSEQKIVKDGISKNGSIFFIVNKFYNDELGSSTEAFPLKEGFFSKNEESLFYFEGYKLVFAPKAEKCYVYHSGSNFPREVFFHNRKKIIIETIRNDMKKMFVEDLSMFLVSPDVLEREHAVKILEEESK